MLEISQSSQDNTCGRVSFLIKLQALGNVSEYLRTLKKTLFLKLGLLKLVKPLITKKINKLERADFCCIEVFSYIALSGYWQNVWCTTSGDTVK